MGKELLILQTGKWLDIGLVPNFFWQLKSDSYLSYIATAMCIQAKGMFVNKLILVALFALAGLLWTAWLNGSWQLQVQSCESQANHRLGDN